MVESGSIPKQQNPKPPRASPAKSVTGYLDALKEADFLEAYEFITQGYASNLDRESYKINMEQSLIRRYGWRLSSYEILGVRILGSLSYVVTKLQVQYKPVNVDTPIIRIVEVQYELNPIDGKWKIASDSCIANCTSVENLFNTESANPN